MVLDGRIYIEKINGPFLYVDRGTPAEHAAGLALAIGRGWLEFHDSGTFVRFERLSRLVSYVSVRRAASPARCRSCRFNLHIKYR